MSRFPENLDLNSVLCLFHNVCLQIYFPQFHLISPIVVVEYRCRGDKQENCLKNSDYQIPGKSKGQNRKIIFTSMTDMPSHVTKREPPASPISQSILYKLCRLSAKTRCWQKETKELLQNEWTPILTTWGRFLLGNIVSAALVSCCYLINPTSQATAYVVPPCGDFVYYIKVIIRCPKSSNPTLLSVNIHIIFRDTSVSVAPVAISQSQAVLLYTSLCDPRLSRFSEAATAIMCFSNKCVIYIVFVVNKCTHICMMGFWVSSMKILTHFSINLSLHRARMHVSNNCIIYTVFFLSMEHSTQVYEMSRFYVWNY